MKIGKKQIKKKESRFLGQFKLLNPRNLAKEVHIYGYNYSWKMHLLLNICSLLGIAAIGLLFQMQPVYLSVIVVVALLVLPLMIRDTYKRAYEQKRFADVTTYMEQMLYSFQKSQKITSALQETREIFEEGQMRDCIDQALAYLEEGWARTEKGVLREALELIETPYRCAKITVVHELLVHGEEYGGDMENSIILLLNDLELWKRNGYKLQANKKKSHADNLISIAAATILSAVVLYVLDGMSTLFPGKTDVQIMQVNVIQVSSMLFILYLLHIVLKSVRSLTDNWLEKQSMQNEGILLRSYEMVTHYDEGKEKKKSLIMTGVFLFSGAAAIFFHHRWCGILCMVLAAVMLLQHKIGYNMAKKEVHNEMYLALPQWLMQIALLLQSNNVQVSIVKSMESAPPILQEELELLMKRLEEEPGNLKSYTDFCKDFDVPEAQSCMKMLHAISESGTGNARIQIDNLIQRVHEMQDMADQIRDKQLAFKMRMISSYPVFGATAKLLVDMTVGMLYMFQMIGNIGM